MGTRIIGNAIVSTVKVDFTCPECDKAYTEADYYDRLCNSKNGFINKQYKQCGIRMGISSDIMGNVVIWDNTPKR